MDLLELLKKTVELNASDLHITVARPPTMRINGSLTPFGSIPLSTADTLSLVQQILTHAQFKDLESRGEIDLSFSNPGLGRFRVNAYKQRGSYSIAIRIVNLVIPSLEALGLPPVFKELALKQRGLILVTGPTGSGKSTTLAAMLDYINHCRCCHILTLEDPIEYLHKHCKSMVNQREIGNDSSSFASALRAALRQDPDVILVGEMRDTETIATALTAAETGHLVLSTLHTIGAAKTIDRIIDVFPPAQQQQVRVQLSALVEGVISQQLIARDDGSGRVAALELMLGTPAIKNLIREGKTHQIQSSIQIGFKYGMRTMDNSIAELYRQGVISADSAYTYAVDREAMEQTVR